MLKTIFICLMLAVTSFLNAQEKAPFTIRGEIDTIPLAKYRVIYFDDGVEVLDSIKLDEHRQFTFQASVGEPTNILLIIDNDFNPRLVINQIVYNFWVQPGEEIQFHGHTGWLRGPKNNLMMDDDKYSISGASLDAVARSYEIGRTEKFQSYREKVNRKLENSESDSLNNVIIKDFVKKNPDSFYSLYLLNRQMRSRTDNVQFVSTLETLLSSQLKTTYSGRILAQRIQELPNLAVGKFLPLFEVSDEKGNVVKLADFKGKYVLVDFWASWCGPCRKEFPHLRDLYAKYKDQDFEIMAVSIDDGAEEWLKAVKEENLSWVNTLDAGGFQSPLYKRFNLSGVPDNFLLDRTGKIVARNLRGADLEKTLNELMTKDEN